MLSDLVICLFQLISFTYILYNIIDIKIDFKKCRSYTLLMIGFILTLFAYKSFDNLLRPIMMFVSYTLIYKMMFKIKISESVINCFIGYIVTAIAEILLAISYATIALLDKNIANYIFNTVLGSLLSFAIIIIILLIFKNKFIKLKDIIFQKINNNLIWIVTICIASFLSINLNNNKINVNYIFTTVSCSLIVIVLMYLFKEIIDKNRIKDDYNKLYAYSENTESILTKYQKVNHENKNQLILIKESLDNSDKTKALINEILADDVKPIDKHLTELKNISNGGLKGMLSYKINDMNSKNIKVFVSISPRLNEMKFFDMYGAKFYKELCQIIGVFVDNARDECLNTKEKSVTIEMYPQNNKTYIIISNSCSSDVNVAKIDEPGYTTKGKGHGVGLSLVKDIVKNNKHINTKNEMIKNYFYQYIIIDSK